MRNHGDHSTRLLLTGPPGSGKTRRLLGRFNEARRQGEEDRALLIVPDASAREHVREVLARFAPPDTPPVFSDNGVHSIFSLIGTLGGALSTGPAHCRALVEKWVDEGTLDARRLPLLETHGGRASLTKAIKTLREHGYDSERLAWDGGSMLGDDSVLVKALRLWEEWLAKTGHRDQRDVMEAAAAAAAKTTWWLVLIDGFTEIPALQWVVIEALIRNARESFAALDPAQPPSGTLLLQFRDMGFVEETQPDVGRWEKSSALEWLSCVDRWKIEAPGPTEPCPDPSVDELVFIQAADPRVEAAALAREVARCIRDGYEYGDIAVLAPHLGQAHPTLESEFRRAGIPLRCYIDRPLVETSTGALADAALALAEGDWSDERVCALLSHPESGVSADEARRASLHIGKDERLGNADSWLRWTADEKTGSMSRLLGGIAHLMKSPRVDPEDFAEAILELIATPVHESWRDLPAESLTEEAWTWERVEGALKSAARALSEIEGELPPLRVTEFIRSELRAAQARPLDRRRDCVNAVTLLGARTWSVPVAMVFGLARDYFPHRATADPFLPDDLCKALDPPLPTSEELKEREEALFRIAITRANDRLVLSRPVSDGDGSPLLPSAPLEKCRELIGEQNAKKLTRTVLSDPPADLEKAVFSTDIAVLALEQGMESGELIDELSHRCDRPLEYSVGRNHYEDARLEDSTALIEAACGSLEHPITPTHLNNLAQCPYRFFAARLLGLREPARYRIRNGLDYLQWGLIAHDALAEWHRGGRKDRLETLVEAAADERLRGIPRTSETNAKIRQIADALERFKRFEERQWPNGFEQKYAELVFDSREPREGAHGTELRPPIELENVGPYTLILGGRIDRIDTAEGNRALVADYKRSAAGDFKRLSEGHDFQLASYIALAEQGLGLNVVLAFFVPLREILEKGLGRVLAASDAAEAPGKTASKKKEAIDPDEHLKQAMEAIAKLIDGLSTGEITPNPKDEKLCKGRCPFRDLCRFYEAADESGTEGGEE